MTETPALNLEYEYKARNPNQLVLLLEDNQLLHKLAKNFAVRITCLSQHMITVYEQVVALLKPAEVSLLYSMDGISITEETFPSLQHVPFIRLEEQQFLFFDYLLAIPRVEGGSLKKTDVQTILHKWAAGKTDFKLKKHVYMGKKTITPQFLTECFEQHGGGLRAGEHLPTWSCDKDGRRLVLVKKNRDIVITTVNL